MRTWHSVYRLDTGVFTGARIRARSMKRVRPPDGCAFLEGEYDPRSQRVDIATGQIVAYERPAAEIAAEQKAARDRRARQRIERLELSQLRSMRELAIDPNNGTAKRRLAEIEAEIVGLRVDLA